MADKISRKIRCRWSNFLAREKLEVFISIKIKRRVWIKKKVGIWRRGPEVDQVADREVDRNQD